MGGCELRLEPALDLVHRADGLAPCRAIEFCPLAVILVVDCVHFSRLSLLSPSHGRQRAAWRVVDVLQILTCTGFLWFRYAFLRL